MGTKVRKLAEILDSLEDEGLVNSREIFVQLYAIAVDRNEKTTDRLAAMREWNDRRFGRAPVALTGADGGDLFADSGQLSERLVQLISLVAGRRS